MFVAVDDTDSMKGNCTTFLATEIIKEFDDFDLIGHPRLVRLNPAIPWKTRGNGAPVLRFGRGSGPKRFIGMIGGKEVYCYDRCTHFEPDPEIMMKRIIPLIEAYHEDDADSGLLISKVKPSQSFYWRGVRTIMERAHIDIEIARIGGLTFTIGSGRGLVGCTCGMAWRPRDSTFELLAYRPKSRWGTERIYKAETIMEVEHGLPSTFNSWEDRTRKVAMVPSTPCPVLYGLRGDNESDLLRGHDIIRTEPQDRWIIFLTNQGTDDHIIHNPVELIPNRSYSIPGIVSSRTRHIKGGHVFFDIETRWGRVHCGIYEPSKEFRMVADWLCLGDEVKVLGELREDPRTLNVEKIHVISTVPEFRKVSNPICPICSCTMKSTGKGEKFKCKKCGTKSYASVMQSVRRQIVPGWYESPTAARRHISKPLKRMGVTQPLEFVNGRS